MKFSLGRIALFLGMILPFASGLLHSEDITTVDGKVWSTSSFRRSGSSIMVKVTTDGGGVMEMGIPVSRITKVAFVVPPQLAKAQAVAAAGNANEVLSLTADYVASQADYKDLPGSWWLEMAKLRLLALAASEKDADTVALAQQIGSLKSPDSEALARGGALFGPLSSGDTEADVLGAKALPRLGGGEGSALAQIALGRAMLLKKDYTAAIRAFLTVKVFYPSLQLLQPEALYGALQAYIGLGDGKRAEQTIQYLKEHFPDSLQTTKAKKLQLPDSKS